MRFFQFLFDAGPRRWALLALSTMLCMPLLIAATYNVRSFGAKGDGQTNDAPAIQAAEDAAERAGGGEVYLPAGHYLMDETIVIGSNIDFHGDGDQTVLIRSNHPTLERLYGQDCTSQHPPTSYMRLILMNRDYNCIDSNLHLHDFKADGSRIVTVPNSCFLCFSGLENSTVAHITVVNSPMDSMFFRNGGDNLVVENNTILMHNRVWGNGAGINVEMHKEGHLWGPVTIRNNTIVTAGPNFCTAALDHVCSRDADCAGLLPQTCGHGAATSAAIAVSWIDGPHPPEVQITGNHIWVANRHYGIICNGCANSTIEGNVILPASFRGFGGDSTFIGISSYATPAGQPHDMTIESNTIEGTDRPSDGAAIQITDASAHSDGVTVHGNVIAHKNSASALVLVRGWDHVNVSGNTLCAAPRNAVRLGEPSLPVGHVRQSGNVIAPPGKTLPPACSNLAAPLSADQSPQ
jgi:hypothetical protein